MSEIIRKLQTIRTGLKGIDSLHQEPLLTACPIEETPDSKMYELFNEYILRVELGTKFRADRFNFLQAEEHALKMIARILYSEVHTGLDKILCAIYGGDLKEAVKACDDLAKSIE